MSFRIEFNGSIHIENKDEAKREARFIEESLNRLNAGRDARNFVSLTDYATLTHIPFAEPTPVKAYTGGQIAESIARNIATTLIKANVVDVPDEEKDSFASYIVVPDGLNHYEVDYRNLLVALREYAVDADGFKDAFKAAVAEANLKGVSFK